MLAQVWSASVAGVDSVLVRVEVNVAPGLPMVAVVGLPQGAVREGRDRVRAAIRNSGWRLPAVRITVNLAPADLKKEGSAFDLPMAVGLLAGLGHLDPAALVGTAFLGELGLDGELRPVRGALPAALRCRAEGIDVLVVPEANADEAASAGAPPVVLAAPSLGDVAAHFGGGSRLPRRSPPARTPGSGPGPAPGATDLAEVRGQRLARRALEVAAAGGHHLLLTGAPGSGKTLIARALPGILPPLDHAEALEVTSIHSVAGLLPPGSGLLYHRPFRAPHHTVSPQGLVGGGNPARPGEVSLAHQGVLFLDELTEFSRSALEALRQPMEDGVVWVVRTRSRVRFPARFSLVAATNPCPCGLIGDPDRPCLCDPGVVARYRSRISGPLRDRLDLQVEVRPLPVERLLEDGRGESSAKVLERVLAARERQTHRLGRGRALRGAVTNAAMGPGELRRFVRPDRAGTLLLQAAATRLGLSARGVHRVLKVARTVADLEGAAGVAEAHLAEALQYRMEEPAGVGGRARR